MSEIASLLGLCSSVPKVSGTVSGQLRLRQWHNQSDPLLGLGLISFHLRSFFWVSGSWGNGNTCQVLYLSKRAWNSLRGLCVWGCRSTLNWSRNVPGVHPDLVYSLGCYFRMFLFLWQRQNRDGYVVSWHSSLLLLKNPAWADQLLNWSQIGNWVKLVRPCTLISAGRK